MNVAGSNVRTFRQQVGMSLRALADAAEIDPATISRIENGKQNLTEELASKIAKVLNCSQGMLFADAGTLEIAMLHMRKVPILTAEQLLEWRGPEKFDEAPEQEYLHTRISVGSRHMFGFWVTDAANAPEIQPGNVLIFDARRKPVMGEFVLAQTKSGEVTIGRLRVRPTGDHFDVVPSDRLFPEAATSNSELLIIRGVLAELRKYFKA